MTEAERVEQAVLDTLADYPTLSPLELIDRVRDACGASDADVREALWRLIDRTQISFTEDRTLKIPA